jgi:ribonuclease-3
LEKANIKNRVNDLSIWQNAFIHSSYSKNCKRNRKYNGFLQQSEIENDISSDEEYNECIPIQENSNERLEWLGDGILQSVVASYLWKRYPKQDEGFLTKIRSKLVKTESLSKFAKYFGFEEFIIISKHIEENCNGRNNSHILEDSFEAFIGAMFIDFGDKNESTGFGICRKFIINVIEECVDFTDLIINDDNFKDQLMRFYQKNFNGKFPLYHEEMFDEENKIFHMYVTHPLTNKIVGKGRAQSKKKAEQLAAKQALNFFNIN